MIGQEGTVARSFGDAEVGSSIPLGDRVCSSVLRFTFTFGEP